MAVYLGSNQVNILGGLNGSYTLLATQEFTTSTTSTSNTSIGTMTIEGISDANAIIYIRVRDKAGKRTGHFYGSDSFFLNTNKANSSTTAQSTALRYIHSCDTSGNWYGYSGATGAGYGVFPGTIINNNTNSLTMYTKYNGTYSKTIDGTYTVEVYKLTYPDNVSPFDA